MELDLPLQKIAISGSTLSSILQRFSSSPGDVDGLLFGHVTQPTTSHLQDDDAVVASSSSSNSSTSTSTATHIANVTGYFCSGTVSSFHDSLGRINLSSLRRSLGNRSLIGWFVGRRKTALRPSMREFQVSSSLCNTKQTLEDFPPCVFFLLSTPSLDQLIHTHVYKAFQFRSSSSSFEPKSVEIVNIGPAFRGSYGAFGATSPFPMLPCVLRDSSAMAIDEDEGLKAAKEEQEALDRCAEGFEVGKLRRLIGADAAGYTSGVEELYEKMLVKLEGLARQVETSSAKVLEQEQRNTKLRSRFAGLE